MDDGGMALVPGRECGACRVCCVDLAIVEDGMRKLPHVPCEHLCSEGCGIYPQRPRVCRVYDCAWRGLADLDDGWRPDLSGVLIQWAGVPAGVTADYAVDLVLVAAPAVLITDGFAGLAAGFIGHGILTCLQISHGPHFAPGRGYLNKVMAPAVAANDYAEIKRLAGAVYDTLRAEPRVPVTLAYYEAS